MSTVTDNTAPAVTCQILFGGYAARPVQSGEWPNQPPAGTRSPPRQGPGRVAAEAVDAERVLAFVNTLSGRPTAAPVERLESYDALVDWARAAALVSAAAAERLRRGAQASAPGRAGLDARARVSRSAATRWWPAIDAGRQPAPAVLDTIGDCLAAAYAHGRLVPHDGALQWVRERRRRPRSRPLGDRARGRTAGGVRRAGPRPRLRGRRLRLVVRGRHQEPQPPLVRYEDLREPRKDTALPEKTRCLGCQGCQGCQGVKVPSVPVPGSVPVPLVGVSRIVPMIRAALLLACTLWTTGTLQQRRRAGARTFRGAVRDNEGRDANRVFSRVGAAWRRSLLRAGHRRLLRRFGVLPHPRQDLGAVRHQR